MKFYYLDDEDYEVGPFDENALFQAAQNGEVGRETLIRNHMMEDDWRPAWRYDFLTKALPPPDEPPPDHIPDEFLKYGVYARFLVEKKETENSRFNYKVIPDYAKFSMRLMAAVYDLGLWVVVTFIFCLMMIGLTDKQVVATAAAVAAPQPVQSAPAVEGEAVETPAAPEVPISVKIENGMIQWQSNPGEMLLIPVADLTGKFGFVAFVTGFSWLIYFAAAIGFKAQTFGMWYWGLLVVRPNLKEVFPFRAFCYTIAFVLLGWTFAAVFPFMGMSLPDKICGVRVVRTSSRALKK